MSCLKFLTKFWKKLYNEIEKTSPEEYPPFHGAIMGAGIAVPMKKKFGLGGLKKVIDKGNRKLILLGCMFCKEFVRDSFEFNKDENLLEIWFYDESSFPSIEPLPSKMTTGRYSVNSIGGSNWHSTNYFKV